MRNGCNGRHSLTVSRTKLVNPPAAASAISRPAASWIWWLLPSTITGRRT